MLACSPFPWLLFLCAFQYLCVSLGFIPLCFPIFVCFLGFSSSFFLFSSKCAAVTTLNLAFQGVESYGCQSTLAVNFSLSAYTIPAAAVVRFP